MMHSCFARSIRVTETKIWSFRSQAHPPRIFWRALSFLWAHSTQPRGIEGKIAGTPLADRAGMKRLFAAVLVFAAVGCGSNKSPENPITKGQDDFVTIERDYSG